MATLLQRLKANFAKIATITLLATPAVMSFSGMQQASNENRKLTDFPPRPSSFGDALKYPSKLDLWINDHFGFRDALLQLNNRLRHALFHQFPTIQVIEGRNDRIFLSAHSTEHQPYSAILLNCGYQFNNLGHLVDALNRFSAGLRNRGVNAHLLIAPSASSLYTDELPPWLEKRCNSYASPIGQIIHSPQLHGDAKALLYYPMDKMRALRNEVDVIPRSWFHWAGAGPRRIARFSAEDLWSRNTSDAKPMVTVKRLVPSDISHLFPGIPLASEMEVADFAASGISQCRGGACFPEMLSIMEKLGDVSRYVNNAAPAGRLILVSDSFGQHIAGWYSSYYREVLHVSTNDLRRLDPRELEQLRETLFKGNSSDNVLFLFHDGSILNGRMVQDIGDWAL